MRTFSSLLLSLALVAATGCATMRQFHTPVSALEGQSMAPALLTAAERQGLRAHHHDATVQVVLEDGTDLYWAPGADGSSFALTVHLPSETPEPRLEASFQSAKARANQLWAEAVATRQGALPAMVVVMPGQAPVAVVSQAQCRSSIDCGAGEFCRDRGDGVRLCMGHGRAGDFCSGSTDCGAGLFCRDSARGLHQCQ